jgi:hypothetical protein
VKTIKPLRLSVLTRPFLRAQSQRLALTVIGMHTLGEGGVLLPNWETSPRSISAFPSCGPNSW